MRKRLGILIFLVLALLLICGLVTIVALTTSKAPTAPSSTRLESVTPSRPTVQPTRSQTGSANPLSGLNGLPSLPGLMQNLGPLQILPTLLGVALDPMAAIRETIWTWVVWQFWAGLILGIVLALSGKPFDPDISPRLIFAGAFGPGLIVGIPAGYFVWAVFSHYVLRR